jgi:hypothetical protein
MRGEEEEGVGSVGGRQHYCKALQQSADWHEGKVKEEKKKKRK